MGKMLRNLIVLSSWWTLKITQGVNNVQLSRDFFKFSSECVFAV